MRRFALVGLLLTVGVAAPRAQRVLTADQRDADLNQLAAMYAKEYAPYEWKRDVIGFDLYRLTPWQQQIHQSADLDVQEAFMEYLASLQDTHASVFFPSPFGAVLGFTVDIYDGKVLIDSVDRSLLPSAQYPFGVDRFQVDAFDALDRGEHVVVAVPTGLRLEIPPGYEGQIRARSGLAAKHAIGVPNAPGTIDADYRGEVKVLLVNWGRAPFVVKRGERVAQLVIAPVARASLDIVTELSATARGDGGFGHTGR